MPPASSVPSADHCPLACIERTERERHELLGVGSPGRRNGARRCAGLTSTVAAISSGVVDRRAARVPAAERREEDVLLAPHDALGPAGRAAGVEHVVVVARAGAEVARRRTRPHERARTRSAPAIDGADVDERAESGTRVDVAPVGARRRGTSATISASSKRYASSSAT